MVATDPCAFNKDNGAVFGGAATDGIMTFTTCGRIKGGIADFENIVGKLHQYRISGKDDEVPGSIENSSEAFFYGDGQRPRTLCIL